MTYSVDIPSYAVEEWDEVGTFDTREDAIAFATARFGADDEGRITIVSEIPEDEEDLA